MPLHELLPLLRETKALIGAAPGRLAGLFLLVFLPAQLVGGLGYAGVPLRVAVSAIAFAGFFRALDTVRQGRAPSFADVLSPWRLPPDKLLLLVAAGLGPLLVALLVWWLDLGWAAVDAYLAGQDPSQPLPLRQELELVIVLNVLDGPLLFIQALCVIHPWSATRTLAANLLAVVANWRWVVLLALSSVVLSLGLDVFDANSWPQTLLSIALGLAIAIALTSFTLVLLRRALV